MTTLTDPQHRRQRVAALSRHRPDSAELKAARRDLAAAKIAEYVQRTVAAAPPLTNEQRSTIAQLLSPHVVVGGGGHDAA